MKLASTSADFSFYVDTIAERVKCFKETKFKYINLAQSASQHELFSENEDDWRKTADDFGDTHHHSWPFAGIINFDSVLQALLDVRYDGYFTFEACYTLLHERNLPYHCQPWEHNGEVVTRLLNPSLALKKQAVDLLYETGKYILETYDCFEE